MLAGMAGVLRPARPERARCLAALDAYLAARDDRLQTRIRSLAEIEERIQRAREKVFGEGTGVVGAEMTALEREWREASRDVSQGAVLDRFWTQVAPERWRAEPPRVTGSAEAMATLASDPEGVEAAERAAASLRGALATWQVTIGARVEWCVAREITFAVRAEELFAGPVAALSELADHAAVQAAHRVRRDVRERLGAQKTPTRNSSIAREIGVLAFGASLWESAAARLDANVVDPFAPALEVWRLGYALTGADASGVVLTAALDLR